MAIWLEAVTGGGGSDWFYVVVINAPAGANVKVNDGDEDIDAVVPGVGYIGIPVHNENSTYTITVEMNGLTAPTQQFTTGSQSGQMTEKTFEFAEIQLTYDDEFRGQTITFTDGTHTPSPAIVLPGAPDNEISIFVPYTGSWSMSAVDPVSGDTFYSSPNPIVVSSLSQVVSSHLFVIPDGKTVTPTDDITIWLACGNIKDKTYTTLEEVLDDPETLIRLMADNNAVDYMVRSKTWIKSEALVPTLNADSNSVLKSSEQSTSAWKAFDGNPAESGSANKWVANSNANEYIGYQFTSGKVVGLVKVWNETGSYATQGVKTCQVEYSDDGSTWHPGSAQIDAAQGGVTSIITTESNPHIYWRLNCTDNHGGSYITIGELQFYSRIEGITDNELSMEAIGQNDYAVDETVKDSDWCEGIVNSDYFELVLNTKVPEMTDDTHPSGEVSCSTYASSYEGYKAFNNIDTDVSSTNHGWQPSGSIPIDSYIQYEFPSAVLIKKVLIKWSNSYEHKIKIQGSNDGFVNDTNDLTSELTLPANSSYYSQSMEQVLSSNTAYKYYRMIFTNTANTGGYGFKLQFYGREDSGVLSWLNAAGIEKCYLSVEEVLSDRETLQSLMMDHNAVDYLIAAKLFIDAIVNNREAMICIGNSNYASDTLLADSEWIVALAKSIYNTALFNIHVPKMTDNTHPSGEASANGYYTTNYPWCAFDGNDTSYWYNTSIVGELYYEFPSAVNIVAACVLMGIQSAVKFNSAEFKGFDGTNWIHLADLSELHNTTLGTFKDVTLFTGNTAKYTKYGLFGTAPSGNYCAMIYELQFLGHEDVDETKIEIYSAADDQVYYLSSGSPVILGTTDDEGHLSVNRASLPIGDVTIYSNVAKDPDNLSNAYSKTIEITSDTRAIWVMPENTMYWYGYIGGSFCEASPTNGFTLISSRTAQSPIYNINNVEVKPAGSNISCGVSTIVPIDVDILHSIIDSFGTDAYYGYNRDKIVKADDAGYINLGLVAGHKTYRDMDKEIYPIGYAVDASSRYIKFNGWWYGRRNRIANFFSAPNDTIYYMSSGTQVVFAQTNEYGEAYINYALLTPGTYDLYSSVAEDPDNIGSPFHKQFTISSNTTRLYLMPNDNTLYWYGYISENLENRDYINGWTPINSTYKFIKPTFSNNSISLINNGNATYGGIGNKKPITATKIHTILSNVSDANGTCQSDKSGSSQIASLTLANGYNVHTVSFTGYIELYTVNLATRTCNVTALWYE